jgi:ABC-type sugar transport system substrate-binding protein
MSNPLNEESDLVTFVNEHVNAIIAEDLTTEAVKAGLKDAAQHGIPVISIGSAVSSDPAYWGAFNNPFPSMGTLLGQAAGASIPKGGDVALQIDPAGGTGQAQLDNGAEATLKAAGAKIVATHDINGTNLVSDITSATNSQAESDPNLKAIVMDFDSAGPIAATVLKSRGLCGKVKLWTIFADPANLTQIGTGCLTGISNFPLEVNSWAAIDQLAEHFARHAGRGQLLSGWPAMSARYGVVLTTPNVVTKANLPPVGQEPTPAADFAGFFQWKWHDEFGTPAP